MNYTPDLNDTTVSIDTLVIEDTVSIAFETHWAKPGKGRYEAALMDALDKQESHIIRMSRRNARLAAEAVVIDGSGIRGNMTP